MVYFSFAVSSDVDPEVMVTLVQHEWSRVGGVRLQKKEVQTFDSKTSYILPFVHNQGNQSTLIAELTSGLELALQHLRSTDQLPEEHLSRDVPTICLRLMVPRLPGENTHAWQPGLPHKLQLARKVFHVECSAEDLAFLSLLLETAKDLGYFQRLWGKWAMVSKVLDKTASSGEKKRLSNVLHAHSSYQYSMMNDSVSGITNVDGKAALFDSAGTVICTTTLRALLLNKFETKDGTTVFAEVHQQPGGNGVDVVIPNRPESESMVANLNRHAAG